MNCSREKSTTNYINSLGICPKCDEKRVRLELTGSTSCIKSCTICQLRMNGFESRSSEAIVCGEEYNSVLTIMNMVHKDKSGKLQPQEFTWPEGETIEDPIFERNEIQEVNSIDNRIIEL
ncbi:hypothetical protein GLOIN_2v1770338 [Rhizophagus irregularis DAOM 181602=DAOM 197198]|nr:hypothetical protein GLOIN_2v1770338 [Rhizophagus irregularis DAOM 181602=DAOM 197198]